MRWVPWLAVLAVGLMLAGRATRRGPAPQPSRRAHRAPDRAEPAPFAPRLHMPFARGVVVQCVQGNGSDEGRTHSLPQNLHALDFANRVLEEVPIVAAAGGTVAHVVSGAGDDPRAGGGYGNQVRVMHAHGWFTLYAHLDQVEVAVGDRVAAGQRLGTMGRTGLAGDRHLHFSLHQGVVDAPGVPPTREMPELITGSFGPSDPSLDVVFAPRRSRDLRCSVTGQPWSGSLYGSENDGRRTLLGAPPPELASEFVSAAQALGRSVSRRARLWRFSTEVPRTTPEDARRFLAPLLGEAEDDPVFRYAWAVEVEIPSGRWEEAERHLAAAHRLVERPQLFEPWIRGWVENQRGMMALSHGDREGAQAHFARAEELFPDPTVTAFARKHLDAAHP
jgi:murein DD-endopeptidase MepM/ murein hydrolase activator NlpD